MRSACHRRRGSRVSRRHLDDIAFSDQAAPGEQRRVEAELFDLAHGLVADRRRSVASRRRPRVWKRGIGRRRDVPQDAADRHFVTDRRTVTHKPRPRRGQRNGRFRGLDRAKVGTFSDSRAFRRAPRHHIHAIGVDDLPGNQDFEQIGG